MVRNYIIVLLVGLLAASCAQVGIISGGPQDRFAPKPIAEDVVPLNETTHFTGNSVEIPFDEYFQLVNPTQNIRMVLCVDVWISNFIYGVLLGLLLNQKVLIDK